MASWGITADLKWHWDLTRVADGLVSRIEFMQWDLEGAWQAVDLCEYQLQVARAHKYTKHAQGLVNQGLHISRQNIQAIHIMHKDEHPINSNNNKNNKGKVRAF